MNNTQRRVKHDPRSANGARRRAVRARVLREETHCHLCGGPVEKTLPTPHPGSPEVDEILPVSKGGSPHNRANCRLSHRACNRARSDTNIDEWHAKGAARPAARTTTANTPRTWWAQGG